MPQMMPIAWMQMFILINMTLFLIMAKTYFMKINNTQYPSNHFNKKNMTWTW